MRKTAFLVALITVSILCCMGCRKTAPIYNPTSTVTVPQSVSEAKVCKAILTGCTKSGWTAFEAAPNTIEATLNIRRHVAVVTINYNAQQYSITYKDSTNLEAQDGKIHPNYNGWITNLKRNIDLELSTLNH